MYPEILSEETVHRITVYKPALNREIPTKITLILEQNRLPSALYQLGLVFHKGNAVIYQDWTHAASSGERHGSPCLSVAPFTWETS
ncbi:Macrophage Colony-Stimulating Factor 1 Receptor [Manis pentadactyla]|nr:Macrophage Colony-Stimulating Factor 1 Receptor [Manis pentadactyla]